MDEILRAHVERFNAQMEAHAKALRDQADRATAEMHAQQEEFLTWLKAQLKTGEKPPASPAAG